MSKRIIGKCSECGGIVSIPELWWSVKPPVATCERCGATEQQDLPVIPMTPRPRPNKHPYWPKSKPEPYLPCDPWDDTKPCKPEPHFIKIIC